MPIVGHAKMYDQSLLKQAGLTRKNADTVVPAGPGLKDNIKRVLRVIDEQDAVNRYKWIGLPKGLNGRLIERVLYYKGQGMFFKMNDQFYFLPYALSAKEGTGIDVYGRFTGVTPLPFNGSTSDKKAKPLIEGLIYEPYYDPILLSEIVENSKEKNENIVDRGCVLLHDYSEQISQTVLPRQGLNDSILDLMADCLPFMRTALMNATGVEGVRISSEAEAANVLQASSAINRAALNGDKFVPLVTGLETQELTKGAVGKAEEFLLAMQSLDNFRLSTYGLDNGGLFQKKSHILEAEQEMNGGSVGLINDDGLRNRQDMCIIANSIWGGTEGFDFIWCVPNEVTMGVDMTGDGVSGDITPEEGGTIDATE